MLKSKHSPLNPDAESEPTIFINNEHDDAISLHSRHSKISDSESASDDLFDDRHLSQKTKDTLLSIYHNFIVKRNLKE